MNIGVKGSVDHQDFFADSNSLQGLKAGDVAQTKAGLQKVAKEFESLYLKMMMDSMRKAEEIWSEDNPFSSREEGMFRDMLDGQYAKDLSDSGSLGIADMLVKQLSPFIKDAKAKEEAGNNTSQDQKEKYEISRNVSTVNTAINTSTIKTSGVNDQGELLQEMPEGINPETVPLMDSFYNPIQHQVQASLQSNAPSESNSLSQNVSLIPGDPDSFIKTMLPHAEKAAQALGVDPKLLVAQAALETGWGKTLNTDNHGFNLFGIKQSRQWQGEVQNQSTLEYENGQFVRQMASFKAYNSPSESFNDYVDLIQSHYNTQPNLPAQEYVQRLAEGGYATDPQYAEKIMSIYNSDRLAQFSQPTQDINASQVNVALNSYGQNAGIGQLDITKIW
ncbi:MAG TPA: flagellar assembly peptidoglycan hydrolase FlgJ [Gammaproteobacteria bacterium]|nr:flagellar assembly peptidoglycan hydrolase FlgJ [Gammaproteobacteria bacterium]HBF08376.1 flagellar assembly peptidoglycan hydrolase FlgJ [Gammaproteobacteria bacterium]HCK93177.1 flagellar assembly peptidoglycan hydrolase FlgJ [Gammaproteobacteria bacterium]|tara:strand:+ start:41042 stop:42211 length:1170 start_codon:yes stop_codon:yes gene_type:complete